jgi:hypothetical protein
MGGVPMSTNYSPSNIYQFTANNLNFNGQGIQFTATLNSSTPNDFLINYDSLLTGGGLYVMNQTWGDSITFQVVDVNGILPGVPAGTVLKQFLTDWCIRTDGQDQRMPSIVYPAKILPGLYLRAIYKSTAVIGSQPNIGINYDLHKVMF